MATTNNHTLQRNQQFNTYQSPYAWSTNVDHLCFNLGDAATAIVCEFTLVGGALCLPLCWSQTVSVAQRHGRELMQQSRLTMSKGIKRRQVECHLHERAGICHRYCPYVCITNNIIVERIDVRARERPAPGHKRSAIIPIHLERRCVV